MAQQQLTRSQLLAAQVNGRQAEQQWEPRTQPE